MKRLLLSLFSVPLLLSFVSAYNCRTIQTRMENHVADLDNIISEMKILKYQQSYISNSYEAQSYLTRLNALEKYSNELDIQTEELQDEFEYCKDLELEWQQYLKEWDNAKNKVDFYNLENLTSSITNIWIAINKYERAYDILIQFDWNEEFLSNLKTIINKLKSRKTIFEDTEAVFDLSEKWDKAYNRWEKEKALSYYEEALSYNIDNVDTTPIKNMVTRIKSELKQEEQNKKAQEAQIKAQEDQKLSSAITYMRNKWKLELAYVLADIISKKDKKTISNMKTLLESFKLSKDEYTRSIWYVILDKLEELTY